MVGRTRAVTTIISWRSCRNGIELDGFHQSVESSQPADQCVPTGAVLVDHPPLRVQAEVAHHSAEGATVRLTALNERRLGAAFLFGDYLAFTANFQPNLIVPVMTGKFCGGIFGFAIARWIVPRARALAREAW